MDKEKRKQLKEKFIAEKEQKILERENGLTKKRAYYDTEIAKEQEEIEILKLEVEAFKGLKNA